MNNEINSEQTPSSRCGVKAAIQAYVPYIAIFLALIVASSSRYNYDIIMRGRQHWDYHSEALLNDTVIYTDIRNWSQTCYHSGSLVGYIVLIIW